NLLANAAYTRGPQSALTGAEATGANIANQGAALKLGLMQDWYKNHNADGTPSTAVTASSSEALGINSPDTTEDVETKVANAFMPLPTAPPASAIAQDA